MATYATNAKVHGKMALADGKEAADAAYPAEERKIEAVSTASYWAFHGGVAAMCAEAAKCEPLCRMCHRLDPSSRARRPRTPPRGARRAVAEGGAAAWSAACRGVPRRAAACHTCRGVPLGAPSGRVRVEKIAAPGLCFLNELGDVRGLKCSRACSAFCIFERARL